MLNFGKKQKPKDLDLFEIPLLVNKEYRDTWWGTGIRTHTVLLEAFTDGFYYEKDRVKYYRVKLENIVSYYKEDELVFLIKDDNFK